MSDASVAAAIRSAARLVLIEAPGGCGKTYQAHYASELAATIAPARMLVVTHTYAACDVFASRIKGSNRVDIRTIDSLISQIVSAYHSGIGLPADPSAWARKKGNEGYRELAAKAAALVATSPMIARALAQRYSLIVCDEHQDASAEQHAIIMALHAAGSSLRLFGDPMQHIGGGAKSAARAADAQRWADLKAQADVYEELDFPHRWNQNARQLAVASAFSCRKKSDKRAPKWCRLRPRSKSHSMTWRSFSITS
jgi:AAA domain-containing protein